MSCRECRMPVPPEMSALQREVRCHQQLMAGRGTQNCAIIADPEPDNTMRAPGTVAKLLDERKFSRPAHNLSITPSSGISALGFSSGNI